MKKLLCPEFFLGDKVTPEQAAFFHKNGVIVFRNVLKPETVAFFIHELNRIEKKLLDEGVDKINGVPLKFGKDYNGQTIIQRLCFLSTFSTTFHEFLKDPRLVALLELLAPYEGRIAENEKDGLILNHHV
ncbi:MAG TPA: phytanoyl-CoA dioxygenase, partial [Puia sp.]